MINLRCLSCNFNVVKSFVNLLNTNIGNYFPQNYISEN